MRFDNLKLGLTASILLLLLFLISPAILSKNQVNALDPKMLPTGQLIHPAGQTLGFDQRPVDIALSSDKKILFVKCIQNLIIVDAVKLVELQRLPYPKGEAGSMHGLAVSAGGVYVTGSHKTLLNVCQNEDGHWRWCQELALSKDNSNPCGVVLSPDKQLAYVCLSMRNSVAIVDLAAGKLLKEIPTGVCPVSICLDKDGRNAYVSNFGGRHSRAGEHVENSAGTPVLVDDRSIPSSGTISSIDLVAGENTGELAVGLHPADLKFSADGKLLFVANANSDSISIVNPATFKVAETIPVSIHPKLPFGSIPDALCLSADGRWLFTANGGNNALAIVELSSKARSSTVKGFIPAGWFPGALCCDDKILFVANTKGEPSRLNNPGAQKFTSTHVRGSISKLSIPTTDELLKYSKQVKDDSGVNQILSSMNEKARQGRQALPVPERVGEPSSIEHVVYVIKENRTYDQVFGDLPKGNNDPALCTYGREVTPNHHALAEEFVLLDNYYCNGVVSADGHQWATQGVLTDYQEKMFGGHPRGYDFGTDPLANAACNFLWDSALQHGLSFRNYGEFDFPNLVPDTTSWFDVYANFKKTDQQLRFQQSVPMDRLRKYTCAEYPGWNLAIPDVLRVQVFLKELKQYEKNGNLPNLLIVYLPQDHTAGLSKDHPSPRACVADNDLALGQLVEGISHSRFWAKTAIFVNEDDPQDGWDHVDGHRSPCLVISPYAKRQLVLSRFYNQDSVLHTIERILGLPSSNQMTAQAAVMDECFTSVPDLTPYNSKPNQIELDERAGKHVSKASKEELKLIATSNRLDFSRPDRINDDTFNRILWHASKGMNARYPAKLAGAHGRGLKNLKLQLIDTRETDDD